MDRVDFDEWSHDVPDTLLAAAARASSGPIAGTSRSTRPSWRDTSSGVSRRRILDFGCGIGRSVKFLQRSFPHSRVVGTDISEQLPGRGAAGEPRDGVLAAAGLAGGSPVRRRVRGRGLPSHRPRPAGPDAMELLRPAPVGRRTPRRLRAQPVQSGDAIPRGEACPFDRDARLLTRRQVIGLARSRRSPRGPGRVHPLLPGRR